MKLRNTMVHIVYSFFKYSVATVSTLKTVYDCRLEPRPFAPVKKPKLWNP